MTTPPYERAPKVKKPRTPLLPELIWWSALLISVMAIPLVGTSVALAVTDNAQVQMVLFILSCWGCVWAGLWVMKHVDAIERKIRSKKQL